jgi:type I restriction enzyme R subunit
VTTEAFSRVKIDAQLKDEGWDILDPNSVRFEYRVEDGTRADYVLCNRHGHSLAVIEAKKAAINPVEAEAQAKAYAEQLKVPYVFLANGTEVRFWERETEAFPRVVKTFYSQDDLERRAATRQIRKSITARSDRSSDRRARLSDRLHRGAMPRNGRRQHQSLV